MSKIINNTFSEIDYRKFKDIENNFLFPKIIRAELHLTDRCNLKCYFCNQAGRRKQIASEIPFKLIERTLADMEELGLQQIRLSGGGEPTFHPSFLKIIDTIYKKDFELYELTTNGLLCDKRKIDLLFSEKWKFAYFSICAADSDDWVSITSGPKNGFWKIIDNIKYLVEKKISAKSLLPWIELAIGVDGFTYKKLVTAYELACKLGVDGLSFKTYNNIKYSAEIVSSSHVIINQLREIETDIESNRRSIEVSYLLRDLNLNDPALHDSVISTRRTSVVCGDKYSIPCFMPWYGTTIRATGDVIACCAGLVPTILGNIYETPIKSIWLGKKYIELRHKFESILSINGKFSGNLPINIGCTPFASPDEGCPVKIQWEKLIENY